MRSGPGAVYGLEAPMAALGLRADPFPPGPEDGFFFATPALTQHIDLLHNLVQYGDLLLVVIGVEGAGKSALLNQLTVAAAERWRVCRIQGSPGTTRDKLVDELMECFGLPLRPENEGARLDMLKAHLEALERGNQVSLIAVDDADRLPESSCVFLMDLARNPAEFKARLLLTCKPGGLAVAGNYARTPDSVHVIELTPFTLEQTGEYLQARLSHAGYRADNLFGANELRKIHQSSGGIPGAMHPLARAVVSAHAEARGGRLSPSARGVRLVLVLVLLGVVVGVAMSRLPELPVWLGGEPGTAGGEAAEMPGGAGSAPQPGATPAPAPVSQPGTPSAPPPGEVAPAVGEAPTSNAPLQVEVAPVAQERPPAGVKIYALDIPPRNTSAVAGEPAKAPEPAAAAAGSETDTGAGTERATKAPSALAKATQPQAGTATPEDAARGSGALPEDLRGADWLRAQAPDRFVIQLLGTRELGAVEQFARAHALGGQAAWFETSHQGRPWYVLVYGLYSDRAAARAAIAELPAALRGGSPWPRSIASITARGQQ